MESQGCTPLSLLHLWFLWWEDPAEPAAPALWLFRWADLRSGKSWSRIRVWRFLCILREEALWLPINPNVISSNGSKPPKNSRNISVGSLLKYFIYVSMTSWSWLIWMPFTYKKILFTNLPKDKMWEMEKLFKVIVTFLWMVVWMSISSRCMFFRSFVVDVTSFIVRQYLVSFRDLLKPYSCWFLKTKRLYTCTVLSQKIWTLIEVTYNL